MTGDLERNAVLDAFLRHVPFDGWSDRSLDLAGEDAGVSKDAVRALFPAGWRDAAAWFGRRTNDALAADLGATIRPDAPVRERVGAGVRALIVRLAPHREALRRLVGAQLSSGAGVSGLRSLLDSVDTIWRAAGDRATDFSFYTRRGLLAGVVVATVLYWLDDDSEGYADTWAFLDRRIADVMRLHKVSSRFRRAGAGFAAPLTAWRHSPLGRSTRRPRPRPSL